MGMVFAASGIGGPEKLLLLGYTNWTDPHGYCWPSEQRLADDCGISRSTVQRSKRKLIKLNLIKSVRRVNPKTGDPISNLTRVNLPLLASMARKGATYDDNMIALITFDDDDQGAPEETLTGTPDAPETPSDLLTHQSDSDPESNRLRPRVNLTPTPSQSDSQSLIDPEGISLSGDDALEGEATDEREKRAARNNDQAPAVPEQRAGIENVVDADAMTAALPGLGYADALELAPLVADALAAGWTTAGLYEYLAARCDTNRVSFPPAIYRKHLKALPAPQAAAPAAPKATRAELIAACSSCDEYGQITTGSGVAICKHAEAAAALAAA